MNGRMFVGIVIGVIIVVFFMNSCAIVPPGHRGVSVTLGKVNKNVREEGFNLKKPFIEKIIKLPIQQITATTDATCFSSDLQTVHVRCNTLYRIPEGKVVELYQQYKGDPYTALVEPRIQEALKQATALHKAEELVKARTTLKTAVMEKIRLAVGDMIIINDFVINNIDLTKELENAIEQKQIMEQSALTKQYELQKEVKQAEITVVIAKAEAEAVKIKGEALKQSPEVIQLEIAKKWDGKSPTSVVVTSGGANVLLPLK